MCLVLQRSHSAAADKCKLHKRRTRCPRHSNRTCFSYWFKQRQDNAKDMITSPLTFCQSSTTPKALQQKNHVASHFCERPFQVFTFSARLFFVYLMFHQATQESSPFCTCVCLCFAPCRLTSHTRDFSPVKVCCVVLWRSSQGCLQHWLRAPNAP